MNEKKACKIKDEALQNVAGGKDDKKYYVGDMVEVEDVVCSTLFYTIKETRVGKIIAINGSVYTIEVEGKTYNVNEKDIKCLATIKVEGGIAGGW